MKSIRGLHPLLFLTVLLSFAAVFAPFAHAQNIYALVVGSDSDTEGQYAENVNKIANLFKEIKDKDICEEMAVVRFDAENPSGTPASERTAAWLENVNPAANDVVFVYYSRVHRTDDEGVDLDDLASKIREMPTRLKILITDTDLQSIDDAEEIDSTDLSDISASVLRNLLIKPKGFLHLVSNSPNEFSFGDADNGGWFTQALVDAIAEAADADGPASWMQVLEKTKETTKKLYERNAPNFSDDLETTMEHLEKSQTPMAREALPRISAALHVLLVIEDTADVADISVAALNHQRMRGLFRGAENHGICDVKMTSLVNSESTMTPRKVKAWADAVNPSENDTVFIYYSANDSNPEEADSRSELLKSLETAIKSSNAKKSRLQMLIVDTYRVGPALNVPRFGLPYPQTTFHNLFFEHKGLLHLVSRSEDEFSFGDGFGGGWFTRALVEAMYEIREREDFPPQVPNNSRDRKFLRWKEFVEEVRHRTTNIFAKNYPDGFEDPENYPDGFSEEDQKEVLEALENESVEKSQIPMARKLPKKM